MGAIFGKPQQWAFHVNSPVNSEWLVTGEQSGNKHKYESAIR